MSGIGDVDASSVRRVTSSAVTLLAALYAFYLEHQYCGDLDSAVEGDRVWMACCAVINRGADDD